MYTQLLGCVMRLYQMLGFMSVKRQVTCRSWTNGSPFAAKISLWSHTLKYLYRSLKPQTLKVCCGERCFLRTYRPRDIAGYNNPTFLTPSRMIIIQRRLMLNPFPQLINGLDGLLAQRPLVDRL